MTINVDDSGAHHLPAAEDALTRLASVAATSCVPQCFITALRKRDPGVRYQAPVNEHTVTLVVTAGTPLTPARIVAAWTELRAVVDELQQAPVRRCDHLVHAGMPTEIAVAIWERGGARVYACGPNAPADALKGTRTKPQPALRRIRALSPLPLLGPLGEKAAAICTTGVQTLATGATAVGIALPPVAHAEAHRAIPVREYAVDSGDAYTLPGTWPLPLGVPLPRLPKPTPTAPRGKAAPPRPAPQAPAATATPTPAATSEPPKPEPTQLPADATPAPTPSPSDAPSTDSTADAAPTAAPSPTSIGELLDRLRPRHTHRPRPDRPRRPWLSPNR